MLLLTRLPLFLFAQWWWWNWCPSTSTKANDDYDWRMQILKSIPCCCDVGCWPAMLTAEERASDGISRDPDAFFIISGVGLHSTEWWNFPRSWRFFHHFGGAVAQHRVMKFPAILTLFSSFQGWGGWRVPDRVMEFPAILTLFSSFQGSTAQSDGISRPRSWRTEEIFLIHAWKLGQS